eukprot:g6173.t1
MNLASNGELCFSHEFGTYVRQFKGRKHFKVIWSHKLMNSEGKEVDISMLYEYQDPSGKYMLGCQGHPEKPATEPSVRQELFGRFFRAVERVRTRGGSVRGSEELEQVLGGAQEIMDKMKSSVLGLPAMHYYGWYSPQCVGINDLHEKVLRGCPSFEMCCFFDGHHGARCWDAQAGYTYERCCSLGSENNERHIPLWHSRWILLELRNGGYLNISQEPTSNEWAAYRDENIPGLLWKSAYAMFRWLEALAAPPFQIFRDFIAVGFRVLSELTPRVDRGGRRVLELGAGIGLLSIMAALGGAAEVVSTDASWSSVGLIERNAQYTHTRGVRGAVAARQLDWANVTNMQSERLARRRLQDLQIGPGPFDVVICSALGYVKLTTFKALLCILDLVTDQQSLLLWGGGGSSTNDLNVPLSSRTPTAVAANVASALPLQTEESRRCTITRAVASALGLPAKQAAQAAAISSGFDAASYSSSLTQLSSFADPSLFAAAVQQHLGAKAAEMSDFQTLSFGFAVAMESFQGYAMPLQVALFMLDPTRRSVSEGPRRSIDAGGVGCNGFSSCI